MRTMRCSPIKLNNVMGDIGREPCEWEWVGVPGPAQPQYKQAEVLEGRLEVWEGWDGGRDSATRPE